MESAALVVGRAVVTVESRQVLNERPLSTHCGRSRSERSLGSEPAAPRESTIRRLTACHFATLLFLAASPASACGPPSFFFETGSARLEPTADEQLSEIVFSFRRARPGARLRLTAYADGTGTLAVNRRLAQRRGDAVRVALVRRGIPSRAISIDIWLAPTGDSPDPARRIVVANMSEAQSGCG
jgi:outer membrane protein OmpA-like peptidoglycan-associated protein